MIIFWVNYPFNTRIGVLTVLSFCKQAVVHETEGLLGYIYCDFFRRPDKPNQVKLTALCTTFSLMVDSELCTYQIGIDTHTVGEIQ